MIEHATGLAEYHGIAPIGAEENHEDFRYRVSGALRDNGLLIEAHEAHSNMRYDDPAQGECGPMAGILGGVAMAMQGRDYGRHGSSQVGDDLAAGLYLTSQPRRDADGAVAMMFMAMLSRTR